MCSSDLQRLGELQSELAGMADFTATYLQCQLLLTKVWLQLWFWDCSSRMSLSITVVHPQCFENWCVMKVWALWISVANNLCNGFAMAYVGLCIFLPVQSLFSERNHNGGNCSVASCVVTPLCWWPLEWFLLNCCCSWSSYSVLSQLFGHIPMLKEFFRLDGAKCLLGFLV